jgi:hypothetical protein
MARFAAGLSLLIPAPVCLFAVVGACAQLPPGSPPAAPNTTSTLITLIAAIAALLTARGLMGQAGQRGVVQHTAGCAIKLRSNLIGEEYRRDSANQIQRLKRSLKPSGCTITQSYLVMITLKSSRLNKFLKVGATMPIPMRSHPGLLVAGAMAGWTGSIFIAIGSSFAKTPTSAFLRSKGWTLSL